MGSGVDGTLEDGVTEVGELSIDELVAVIRNDVATYPDAGRVVVPAALEELQRRASGGQGRNAARRALADLNLGTGAGTAPPASADEDGERPLEGAGMAAIDWQRRRYGFAGAGFVSMAAGVAEETRGGGGGDLIVLSVPPGELGHYLDVLEELGARRSTPAG